MQEMTVNGNSISEYGARLLSYSVGGTETSVITGAAKQCNFPVLFHTDYGARKIAVSLVFRPAENGSIFQKLNSLTKQKVRLDGVLYGQIVELMLPDGYYYRCVLEGSGNEVIDGESLEVNYNFSGIRHLEIADPVGMEPYCYSTAPKTDCRIIITVGSTWTSGDDFTLAINRLAGGTTITIPDTKPEDIIELDGINKRIYKSGINVFGSSDIITFPFLVPGKNTYEQRINASVECKYRTEYYPIFV